MKRGETIRVKIERLSPEGSGFAEVQGRALSIKGTVPGDVADARILSVKRHSAKVKLESIVTPGIKRIPAKCSHFGQCGGCRWQDIPYEIQCSMKASLVRTALSEIPGIDPVDDSEFIPSPNQFFYRNKMEYSFDSPPFERDKVSLGLHEAGRFDRIFDLKKCFLQSERSNDVVNATRLFILEHKLTVYGFKSHSGLLRFLMIREGENTGELMINLVTSDEQFAYAGEYADYLASEIDAVTTIVRSINRKKANTAIGEECEVLFGDGFICDRIGTYTFTISPDSFFQTNTRQAENLYNTIREFCNLSGTENLLDLYCGTGTIGIYLAEGAKTVVGVEMLENAVEDARRNASINNIANVTFHTGQVEKLPDEFMSGFDTVVCDPPRTGIHPKALNHLLRMRIPRMVYVSCNVKAMPHDLEMLAMAGYRIRKARVFDMSPHTPHIETVLLLEI